MAGLPEPIPRSPHIEPKADADGVAPMGEHADQVIDCPTFLELLGPPPHAA
jgi:hypothetical protein